MSNGEVGSHILARDIELLTGVPAKTARKVLDSLVDVVGKRLAQDYDARITGFGRFRVRTDTVRTDQLQGFGEELATTYRRQVYFAKSRRLKEILMTAEHEEEGMDKFAVDETAGLTSEALEKMANKGCPLCGKTPERHGSVLICPTHGSEPFEG